MPDYLFKKLDNRLMCIDIVDEKHVQLLWKEYLEEYTVADLPTWCVFLTKKGIKYFVYERISDTK